MKKKTIVSIECNWTWDKDHWEGLMSGIAEEPIEIWADCEGRELNGFFDEMIRGLVFQSMLQNLEDEAEEEEELLN